MTAIFFCRAPYALVKMECSVRIGKGGHRIKVHRWPVNPQPVGEVRSEFKALGAG